VVSPSNHEWTNRLTFTAFPFTLRHAQDEREI
jgi:hypothetical protein